MAAVGSTMTDWRAEAEAVGKRHCSCELVAGEILAFAERYAAEQVRWEREACAEVADAVAQKYVDLEGSEAERNEHNGIWSLLDKQVAAGEVLAAIRARGEET